MACAYLVLSLLAFGHIISDHNVDRFQTFTTIFLTLCYISTQTLRYHGEQPALIVLWTQSMILYVLHVGSTLFIQDSRGISGAGKPISSGKVDLHHRFLSRLRLAYSIAWNPRGLNTQATAQIDGQSRCNQDVPAAFYLRRTGKLVLYTVVYRLVLPGAFNMLVGTLRPSDLSPAKATIIRRLGSITVRECQIRTHFAVSWIVESLIFLDGANCLLAMVFVSTGIDSPGDWPPIFGRPGDITGLRKFWSRSWHQVSTKTYRSYADWMAQKVLMLELTSSRYMTMVAFFVFIISGCCHAVASWYLGAGMEWLEIWWYILNFGGCFMEVMAMKAVYDNVHKRHVLGRIWVLLFFFWAVPKWKYPRLLQEAEGRQWLKQALAVYDTMNPEHPGNNGLLE
ncbi:hypothetical protein KVT40_003660 [Elsinoe batatas]|uniref:Wax synthase domain-containing protein n=1 Tax=Elsinoe batatas TaxID=2601811 RepID=A0A8K0L296_9PEZI|nr:hypothetical protein KVT40_003660 [Elsinoe batatas]